MPLFEKYIRSVELNRSQVPSLMNTLLHYRWLKTLLPCPSTLKSLFLVDENGSGKSTILEAIAVAYPFPDYLGLSGLLNLSDSGWHQTGQV